MATSGTTTTELTRDTIIAAAMRKIGALAKGQDPDAEDLSTGAEALNNLVAQFQTLGMPLWSMKTSTITMVASQQTYTIGVGQAISQAFPLKIIQVWMEPTSGGGRQPLMPSAVYDFYLLPSNSGSTGSPSQYMYQPFINYGKLHLWPIPDASTVANKTLTISYIAPFDEFTAAGNTPYFPKEWNNALIYGLASLLAPEIGLSLNDRASLQREAKDHLDLALDFGMENASITFAPEERLT
jgi:hypothetical protein